jgi:dipeptidase E
MDDQAARGHIIALGGVDAPAPGRRRICDYPRAVAGLRRPDIGVLTTPGGDDPAWDEPFRALFSEPCGIRTFAVFRDGPCDFEPLRRCDIVFVPGGNTVAALAVWRAYGVDELLGEVWRGGGILAGWSADALCWFAAGLTDSLAPDRLLPFGHGLGLLSGSMCPYLDAPGRRDRFAALVGDGTLPAGIGLDEGAIAHHRGLDLARVLITREGHTAHRVTRRGDTSSVEPLDAERW